MADRTRIIEGKWRCTSCGEEGILARHAKCPRCGNPREKEGGESEFDFGAERADGGLEAEAVTDEKAVRRASVGPDWYCTYCGSANAGDRKACLSCGSPRAEGTAGAESELSSGPPAPAQPVARPPPSGRRRGSWVLVGVGLAVAALIARGTWSRQSHAYAGRIAAMSWEREIHREAFAPVVKQGWAEDLRGVAYRPPVQGMGEVAGVENIRACERRQRGTRSVPDGTERVCHSATRREACGTEQKCQVKNLGNGYARESCHDVTRYCDHPYQDCHTQTRYRQVPVYASYCQYDTHEWRAVDSQRASGHDASPQWPQLSAASNERLRREERYTVDVEYRGRGHTLSAQLHPKTETEFRQWSVGEAVTVEATNGGELKQVRPAP